MTRFLGAIIFFLLVNAAEVLYGQEVALDTLPCAGFSVRAEVASYSCGFNISCFGGSDGNIQLSVSGGTEPYFFSWSTKDTTQNLLGIPAGYYSVTIQDSRTCLTSDSFNIIQPDSFQVTACNDQSVALGYPPFEWALLIADASGGCEPYSYFWSGEIPGENSKVHPDISTAYLVQVLDANGCLATDSQTVTVVDVRCGALNDKVLMCANGNLKYVEMVNVYQELQIGSTVGPCDPYLNFDGGDCGDPLFLSCECMNGIRELCLIYSGGNEPDIEFMADSAGSQIIASFLNVDPGTRICINSNSINQKANTILPSRILLRIDGDAIYEIETECNKIKPGDLKGPFFIDSFTDGRDGVCRVGGN